MKKMLSQLNIQYLPLKDLEENLEELLARCRQLRSKELANQNCDNLDIPNNHLKSSDFSPEDTWIIYS